MTITAARRKQNRDAQQRRRERLKAEKERQPEPAREKAAERMPAPQPDGSMSVSSREYVRAGQLAGLLEASFATGLGISGEREAREWLDRHPVGASIVYELLTVAGFSDPFLRWRGVR